MWWCHSPLEAPKFRIEVRILFHNIFITKILLVPQSLWNQLAWTHSPTPYAHHPLVYPPYACMPMLVSPSWSTTFPCHIYATTPMFLPPFLLVVPPQFYICLLFHLSHVYLGENLWLVTIFLWKHFGFLGKNNKGRHSDGHHHHAPSYI